MTGIDGSPSDRSVRIVVAVADAGSFSAAAASLGIGQSAVSHAVARLERSLGVALFERQRTGVTPTAAGAALVARSAPALREVDAALAAVAAEPQGSAVTVSVSTSFATYWLTPRLPDFKQRHPEVELRVLTTDTDRGVGRDDADLWIPLGPIDDAALDSVPFCTERLTPVAAPALAAAIDTTAPPSLVGAPLLHLEERYARRFDWPRWFRHHGVAVPDDLPGDRSNDYSLVLLAALAGTGVALGWDHIVRGLVGDGRLVPVGPSVDTGVHFPLLTRLGRPLPAGAAALRSWLLEHAADG